VLIFEHRHQFARAVFLFEKVNFISERMAHLIPAVRAVEAAIEIRKTQSEGARGVVSFRRLSGCLKIIFPAAGVSAGTLIRVPVVKVPRKEAASGVGDAERSMNENLKLHVWTFLTNLRDLIERQFS
jgi:hypothetical protein